MNSDILDVTDAEFESIVIEGSNQLPVLVDFWAEWCGPCRSLGPVLERMVSEEFQGRLRLAKIDVDQNPAAAQACRVSSIPAVKLFRDGQIVDEFVGALPPDEIRRFLAPHLPSPAGSPLERGWQALDDGNLDPARESVEAARALDAESAEANLLEATIRFAEGNPDEARRMLGELEPEEELAERHAALTARLDIADVAAQEPTGDDPLEPRFIEGHRAAAAGRYQESLELLLSLLETDRSWRDGAARRAMVKVFDVMGRRTPLADEFRDRMARLLY